MKKLIYIIAALAALTGCIDNDLPYPVVVPHITSLTATGTERVDINYDDRTVTLVFPETTDLRDIEITSVEIDEKIAVPSIEIVGRHDLSSPLKFNIRTYADYAWKIVGVRNVQRYFTVEGQIGSSTIDPVNCRAIAMVGKNVDVSDVKVTSLKLGPRGLSTYSVDYTTMKDFTHGVSVDVTAFDLTETWNLFVEVTDASVEITKVNAWAHEVYLTSIGTAGVENGFMYRMKGDAEWIKVDESDITSDGGTFLAHVKGLDSETVYEAVAVSGSDQSPVVEFMTEAAVKIPNGSFEYASKVAGAGYYKFYDPDCGVADGEFMFWGSGNGEGSEGVNGSANLGIVITYIDTEDKVDGKQSVRAQTSQLAGMLAAGNLLKPSDGKPVVVPTQDMILGSYYLTMTNDNNPENSDYNPDNPYEPGAAREAKDENGNPILDENGERILIYNTYTSIDEAMMAYDEGDIGLHVNIKIRMSKEIDGKTVTDFGSSGIGRLRSLSNRPSAASFLFNSSNFCCSEPLPDLLIRRIEN